jgi:hypothetical protein
MDEIQIQDQSAQTETGSDNGHTCEGDSCGHDSHVQENTWTKHRGSEEVALAFLLALTPLVVLTFFGQVGLL